MKTPEDERYVVIKAYKCTVSEIWRDSFVLPYIACSYVVSLHTESTDSVIKCTFSTHPHNICLWFGFKGGDKKNHLRMEK